VDEALTLVEQRPDPLVGAVLVDVVAAIGDLGSGQLDQPGPGLGDPVGREQPFQQAIAVFGQIGLGVRQVGGERCPHGGEGYSLLVVYCETAPPPELAGHVVCTWTAVREPGPNGPVLPDGCVDVLWLADSSLIVAGPD